MIWTDLLAALALVLVIEGLMPFASPHRWRKLLLTVMQLDARSIRVAGAVSMALGLALLYLIRN